MSRRAPGEGEVETTTLPDQDQPIGRLEQRGRQPFTRDTPVEPGHFARRSWRRTVVLGAALFLVLSVIVWWNAWAHPATKTTCACGDPGLFIWFLEWPAHALAHGLDPFHTTAMFAPHGIDLLANTSVLALGVALAPVTWLFGPIVSFNVALTLCPVLSATAMFVLLLRWTSWWPAAWFGALLYGFSPFVLTNLAAGHLMLGMLAVPPLVVLCLDELLLRQRRRPVAMGIVLGLLLVVQFFISTEVLVIMCLATAVGGILLVVYALWRHRERLRHCLCSAVRGLAAAAITSAVLLSFPVWFALNGPSHFAGRIWPGLDLSAEVTVFRDYVIPKPQNVSSLFGTALNHLTGGYQGPVLSAQFVGYGALAVVVVGLAAWHRDLRLWLFVLVGAWSVALSLGAGKQVLNDVPLLQDIVAQRYVLVTDFCLAVALGLVIDQAFGAMGQLQLGARHSSGVAGSGSPVGNRPWIAAAMGLAVAAVALAQPAAYLSQTVPMTAVPAVVPEWFRAAAPHLAADQVVLVLPSPYAIESAMAWQAVGGLPFDMVGGAGPGEVPARIGPEEAGEAVLAYYSKVFSPTRRATTTPDIANVHRAIADWRVTMVVLPDQVKLPSYDQVGSVTSTAALITAATGLPPIHQSEAWVWPAVNAASPPPPLSADQLTRCTAFLPSRGAAAVHRATTCVLGALDNQETRTRF